MLVRRLLPSMRYHRRFVEVVFPDEQSQSALILVAFEEAVRDVKTLASQADIMSQKSASSIAGFGSDVIVVLGIMKKTGVPLQRGITPWL